MVYVTKMDGREIVVNADVIQYVERTPDTLITLTTGQQVLIQQSVEQVVDSVILYKKKCFERLQEKKS